MFRCRVILLDDTRIERDLEKNAVAQVLFDEVCDHLNLIERGYFGLAAWDSSNTRVWLDFSREVHKQIIDHDATFTFSVKFYPPDPSLLAEDLTRYLLCLQVRMDIMTNHLHCPSDVLPVLGSYIVQSEFGDYDPDVHGPGYLRTIPLTPSQTPELEERVTELHRTYKSMTPAQADENFLQIAMALPMYGTDLHAAKDMSGKDVMLGVCAEELIVYEGKAKTQSFPWPRVLKISYIRNKFHLRIRHMQDTAESTISFTLPSYRASKRLWKVAVEHHAFFRNHRKDKYEGLLQLGSRFRFRRNTHTETLQASSNIKRHGPPVPHTAIKKKAKESMLQALKSPTRTELDDWFQVFRFDRSRAISVPETIYSYKETPQPTQVYTKSKKKTQEEEESDEVPEEEQEWFELLSGSSFPKQVLLSSDTEKLERASAHFWKHNSDDWLILLYPKTSETSFWELEITPAGEHEEDFEKEQLEEGGIKMIKIRKSVQFVSEGPEGLQKVINEKLELEGFREGLIEQRTRKVDIEKIQDMMIDESQKTSEEEIKGLEKTMLEIKTTGQRLQEIEGLKVRLQEVEMLEQKWQQVKEEKQLRGQQDAWYILLDRLPFVPSADLIEIGQQREGFRQLVEEPVQKVSPIHTRDVWHILLELLPRSQWATHLPRALSVEEIKAPVPAQARTWEEEMKMREERRRSSQIRISAQYTAGREVQPESDERDDWFNLLAVFPKESVLDVYEETRVEKVRLVEEQVSFIKTEMPFELVQKTHEDMEESERWFMLLDPIPFEKRSAPSDTLERMKKEEAAWKAKMEERKRQQEEKMLLDETVALREMEALQPMLYVEAVPMKIKEESEQLRKVVIVEERKAQLLQEREAMLLEDFYDDWFILFDRSTKDVAYADTAGLRTQRRTTILSEQLTLMEKEVTIEEKPGEEVEKKLTFALSDTDDSWFVLLDPAPFALRSVSIEVSDLRAAEERRFRKVQERRIQEEERRKWEAEERRAHIVMQREEPEMEEGEDWFILLQAPPKIQVDKRVMEEQIKIEDEWMKRTIVEDERKRARIQRGVKDDWFFLMGDSLEMLVSEPKLRPEYKPRQEPKPLPEAKLRPEPKPLQEPKPRPVSKPYPVLEPRPMSPADQPLTSTPTTQPVPITRPSFQDESLMRLDISEDSEAESESVLILKRMVKRMEEKNIYVRHSLLMLEDSDLAHGVILKHHASVRELKRLFLEDMPVSGPTEWDKRLSTHSPIHIPQITKGHTLVTMDTDDTDPVIVRKVKTESVIVRKVEEDEVSAM